MNLILICKKAKKLMPFLLLFVTLSAQAQSVILSGKVVNNNQEPLMGATVVIHELKKGSSTDLEGNFQIKVPKGKHIIEISHVGFYSIKREVSTNDSNIIFDLTSEENVLDEVLVSAVRVKADAPVTHSNLTKKELEKRNLGQDIPVLMNYLPSVVTTSDAGAGVGYTGIRVRGSDASRVNVTINGIPYNDAESQGTFWVNMPDFASSTQSIQLQRGVGTSTNGAGAFGASLNVLTDSDSNTAFGEVATSFGSFNTQKYTAKAGTGKLNDHVSFTGRVSKISSDGYIDRASSDLKSYFLQGSYVDENTLIKTLVFGGHEITYQSWNGNDGETLKTDRTFNSAGALWDENGVTGYYDNEVDDYKQDHYQLHWNQKYSDNLSSNIAVHYTYGRGFYEQYKQDDDFADYNLTPITIGTETINSTDLIRRKWLDNDFYGITYNLNYKNDNWDILFGGAWNRYEGDHFGEIIWARYASDSEIRDHYYDDFGNKEDFNLFAKATYKLNNNISLFADLQNRNVSYKANGVQATLVNDTFNFFNPKAGINYNLNNNNSLYFSYARANREPNRTDYENGNPKPEQLDDFELGWRFNTKNIKVNTNIYYMFYTDQLALTGEIDNVGSPIRANIGESYRLGLEVDAHIAISDYLSVVPNFTISQNKNIDLKETDGTIITNLGDTNISYSPNFIAGNAIVVNPIEDFNVSFLSKYVGSQFMSNTEMSASTLDSYFVNDLNISYTLKPKSVIKEIVLSGLINNIFDEEYSSNGYMWGTTPYYYPQAGTNFLVGATFKF
ncbi:iron complex outermembrane receptor protein [Tenacibaculum adriaticum]|uniref:Iron complex outermembrane receptor protein n=1 Tax=Tenacibaculum adriaticum TaxID=413713 RepID=A0A5S5DZ62_9FLAO|nr:TonB-dependent receptor [Tenacibaculum adriaticum]TYQ00317.1 iron complex outermembrane receptor protein [Tenacibaculum adriaticum]